MPADWPQTPKGSSVWRLLRALHKHGAEFSNGNFTCPVHDDGEPSLSIVIGNKRPVVVHCNPCNATMTQREYVFRLAAELQLDPSIFMTEVGEEPSRWISGAPARGGSSKGKLSSGDWKADYHLVDTYLYRDEFGQSNYLVERWEPNKPGKRKQFVPRWFDGVEWHTGLPSSVSRTPYGLEGFERAKSEGRVCLLVEGEKNAKAANAVGDRRFLATCFPGGAEASLDEGWTDWFTGFAHVIVVADRDAAGVATALKRHAALEASGISVEIAVSATRNDHDDLSDHLDAGHKLEDLEARTTSACRKVLAKWTGQEPPSEIAKSTIERVNADPEISQEGGEVVNPHAQQFFDPNTCRMLYGKSDLGVAQYMIHLFGRNFRYVQEDKSWYVFNGKAWDRDPEGLAMCQLAKQTVAAMREQAELLVPNDDTERTLAQQALTFVTRREDQSAIEKTVKSAKSEPDIAIHISALDANPAILGVRNGVLDLRKGALRPHAEYRDEMITKLAPVIYDPEAKHTEWDQFVSIITGDDSELERFLQRAAFESLTGYTTSKCFINLFDKNKGNTGKSVFVQCIANVLGEYATVISPSAFSKSPNGMDRIPAELANTYGKRMAYVDEITSEVVLDTGLLKRFARGDGEMSYERKYQNPFKAAITATLWMDGNSLGRAFGGDTALYARWRMVEFDHDIVKTLRARGKEVVPGWASEMRRDSTFQSAVLAWCMAGRPEWLSGGIGSTPTIEATVESQKTLVDDMGGFRAGLEMVDGERVTQSEVWQAYREWSDAEEQRRRLGRSKLFEWILNNFQGVEKPSGKKKSASHGSALVFENLVLNREKLGLD